MSKYKSKLEARVAGLLGDNWEYEPPSVPYTIQRNYIPDFKQGDTYIEVKGYFRSGDAAKYKAIAKQMKEDGNMFIMLFQKPFAFVRKGSKTTYAKWCEKNGIAWESTERAWMYAAEESEDE